MIKNIAWNVFKNTGNIDSYLEFNELRNIEENILREDYILSSASGKIKFCRADESYTESFFGIIKEKIKHTNLERYGVENPMQNKEINQKEVNTQRERYGGVGFESKELMDKTKKTNLERYGYENNFASKQISKSSSCLDDNKTGF